MYFYNICRSILRNIYHLMETRMKDEGGKVGRIEVVRGLSSSDGYWPCDNGPSFLSNTYFLLLNPPR